MTTLGEFQKTKIRIIQSDPELRGKFALKLRTHVDIVEQLRVNP
jgi:hypothetical protein